LGDQENVLLRTPGRIKKSALPDIFVVRAANGKAGLVSTRPRMNTFLLLGPVVATDAAAIL
jgi:hypothetical protein